MPPATSTMPHARAAVARWFPLLVVPLLAVTVSLVAGWRFPVQVGDAAWLTQRVADVASSNPPAVGMPSTLGGGELDTHHPGPVQFYWLAPWWLALGHRGIAMGSAAAAAVALFWIGLAARRLPRAGVAVAVGAQLAVSVGALTISPEVFADPWNPMAALAWSMLLVVSAARVSSGDGRGWLGAAVGATVAVQLHAGYLPWVAVVMAALVLVAVRRPGTRPARRTLRLTAAAAAVLWTPPVVDLMVGIHNPVLLVRAAVGSDVDTEVGPGAVVVAAAHALAPFNRSLDAVWVTTDVRAAEVLVVVGALAAACASWWFGKRGRWPRALVGWAGGSALLWMLIAARAPLVDGLLAHSYVRPLWPLGALMWLGVAGVIWERRPASLRHAAWVPAVVALSWVLSVPQGYVGVDPATRLRGAEVVEALAGEWAPAEGVTVWAEGALAGSWIAPAVTATLDHRRIPNGVGTSEQFDHPDMSTRPSPLPASDCAWTVGPAGGDGERLTPPRRATSDERRRLARLEASMERRFAQLRPSRLALDREARSGAPAVPDRDIAELLGSGRFGELVVDGMLAEATTRDDEVQEYLELSRLLAEPWAQTVVTARSCGTGGTP
jgi:hypothetical protein